MPKPKEGEKPSAYIARYIKSKRAQTDFPDLKQRLAVAYSELRQAKKHG